MTSLLDYNGQPIPAGAGTLAKLAANLPSGRAAALTGLPRGPYRGASQTSRELSMFRAPSHSANSAARYSREILADRARDIVRNESLASTGIRKSTAMAIGTGWKLQSRPDAHALGITEDEAADLSAQIERAFRKWADSDGRWCHAQRRQKFGGLLRLMWQEWKTINEVVTVMDFRDRGPTKFGTCVQDVDAARLSNPFGQMDDETLRDGVALDSFGAAVGYHIREGHPSDYSIQGRHLNWKYIPRETHYGRPVCNHGFRQMRVEEHRGVTMFAPLIEQFAMRSKLSRTELQSALLNAVFAAFVKSGFDPVSVSEMLGAPKFSDEVGNFQNIRSAHYEENPVMMDGIQVPILMPGDSIETNTAGRNTSSFEGFTKILNQSLSAALGNAPGQADGNYGGLNYSTLRGAYNEIDMDIKVDCADFGDQNVRPIFLCVLDEAIRIGDVVPPAGCADLWDEPEGWCKSNWIFPARRKIDAEKEAKGDLLRLSAGLTTKTSLAAADGQDYENIVRERAAEARLEERYGVTCEIRDAALAPTIPQPQPEGDSE